MDDKRQHRRVPLVVEVTCIPQGGEPFTATSKDISLGGMFVSAGSSPPFGTAITLRLTFPGHKAPFDLPGTVRWNLPEGFGVQFGLLGARETHAITKLG
ncbi:MAG TPA: PilZ domain-containing protein [Polyangiaceae bacterium]|nr:PilZ domain-containing protein [Polyangiaceae bacterium]